MKSIKRLITPSSNVADDVLKSRVMEFFSKFLHIRKVKLESMSNLYELSK